MSKWTPYNKYRHAYTRDYKDVNIIVYEGIRDNEWFYIIDGSNDYPIGPYESLEEAITLSIDFIDNIQSIDIENILRKIK
jgi:hypothetical protein